LGICTNYKPPIFATGMKSVKKIIKQALTILPLAVMGLFLLNNTLFTHTHILPGGRIIVHAHPMKMADSYTWVAGNSGGAAISSDATTGSSTSASGLPTDSQGDTGNTAGKTGTSPEKSHHTHSQLEYTYLDNMSQEFQYFPALLALIIPVIILHFYTRQCNAASHLFGHLPLGRAPPASV